MLPDKDIGCHRTGFARKCRELVASGECGRFIQVCGKNPNTGEDISKWDCVDNWTPFLLIENTQQQRQTGAAVESFRNEMVQANGVASLRLSAMQKEPAQAPRIINSAGWNGEPYCAAEGTADVD